MSRAKYLRKRRARKEAAAKLPVLFRMASEEPDQRVADRLVRKARRLAMKFRMSLRPYKHIYCKHCYSRLIPGRNSRVRINNNKVVIFCFNCKRYRRIPLKGGRNETLRQ